MGDPEQTEQLPDAARGRPARGLVARSRLIAFALARSGATAIEYGLIASLIFLVILGAVTAFGNNATNMYNTIATTISSSM
jgi:pilus assembly protein Flp/PilA